MRRAIVAPELGAAGATFSLWYARRGERVYAGEPVVELIIGVATFDVSAPVTGRLVEQSVRPHDRVTAGQVLGYLDEEADS